MSKTASKLNDIGMLLEITSKAIAYTDKLNKIESKKLIKVKNNYASGVVFEIPNQIKENFDRVYSPLMFENEILKNPFWTNVEVRKLTQEELANQKPKGRFQLRAEQRKEQETFKGNSTSILEAYNPEIFYIQKSDIKSMPNEPAGNTRT